VDLPGAVWFPSMMFLETWADRGTSIHLILVASATHHCCWQLQYLLQL